MSIEMQILEWNINQKGLITPNYIIESLDTKRKDRNLNLDIIILTEFNKTKSGYESIVYPLEERGYIVILDPRPLRKDIRQIVIAIKAEHLKNNNFCVHLLNDNENKIYSSENPMPNYLRVDMELKNATQKIPLSIVGTRIRTKSFAGADEHSFRQKQFDNLLAELPTERILIVSGDMNIAPHEHYQRDKVCWHYENNYRQALCKNGYVLSVPSKGTSSGIYKMDHTIVSKGIMCETEYIPSSIENRDNYPDHNMLLSKVTIY